MNIITCPNCKVRVIPKANGICPNCLSIIPKQKRTSLSKLVKPNKKRERVAKSKLHPECLPETKNPASTEGLTLERDDPDEVSVKKKFDWTSINWKKAYAVDRFRAWDNWLVIAVISIGFAVYSLISNRPLTFTFAGLEITNQYISNIALVAGMAVAIYRIREMFFRNRLVINGRIIKKEIVNWGRRDIRYKFLINVSKEFTLSAKGELEPSDSQGKLHRSFMVNPSLYRLYNKDDTITLLFFSNGELIRDLREYV